MVLVAQKYCNAKVLPIITSSWSILITAVPLGIGLVLDIVKMLSIALVSHFHTILTCLDPSSKRSASAPAARATQTRTELESIIVMAGLNAQQKQNTLKGDRFMDLLHKPNGK